MMDPRHWFILAALLLGMMMLVAIGPLLGWLIERSRHRSSLRDLRDATAERVFRFEEWRDRHPLWSRSMDARPFVCTTRTADQPTLAIPVIVSEPPIETPSALDLWLGDLRAARPDDTVMIDMAELVEPTEAELAFEADPLDSWCLPPDVEYASTPIAVETLACLVGAAA